MIIPSLDIETTGLEQEHQLLEFAIVLEDFKNLKPLAELPRFKFYVAHENYTISSSLIALNKVYKTLEMIQKIVNVQVTKEFKTRGIAVVNGELFLTPEHVSSVLYDFLDKHGLKKDERGRIYIKAAGKNAGGYDIPFFKKTAVDWESYFNFSHRTLDVGSLFFDPLKDEGVPGLSECKKRAGLEDEVSHDAFNDALDVVKLLRYHFKLDDQKKPEIKI